MAIKYLDEEADYILPLTAGERDALRDMLDHTSRAHRNGKARMSAAEEIDVLNLIEKVKAL